MDACTSSLGLLGGESLLVLGLGDSGLAMARWCVAEGAAAVAVWDSRDSAPQDAQLAAELPQVQRQRGAQPALPPQCTRVLKSPGLAPQDARIAEVLGAGLPVQGELGLFAQALAHLKREWRYEPAVLAITGTNGKTTTTALTGQLCEADGRRVAVAGNIGPTLLDTLRAALLAEGPRPQAELALAPDEPPAPAATEPAGSEPIAAPASPGEDGVSIEQLDEMLDTHALPIDPPPPRAPQFEALPQVWVLELSSFQLDGLGSGEEGFEPTAATVLNLSQDHLDWHGDMAAYAAAKAGVFGQRALMVVNRDDPLVEALVPQAPPPPLGARGKPLKATVKSVARWTWDRYTGCGRCHRGVMQLDKDLPLIERQRLAAARTHDVRHKATESKVRAACRLLQQKGEALTQAAIGRVAGLTRQTVATYKHVLEEVLKPVAVAILGGASGKADDVKHGAHQVTAAPQGAGVPGAASVSLELFPAGPGVVPVLDG